MKEVLIALLLIAVLAVGISVFWRTCIYTRGAIFRPIGRLLDLWVIKGCSPQASFFDKLLRFLAYPLGRCIYCSGFHFTYETFFVVNYFFLDNSLDYLWLIVVLPVQHLFLIVFMKLFISSNEDMERGDWDYMLKDKFRVLDLPNYRHDSPLTPEEEVALEICKNGEVRG